MDVARLNFSHGDPSFLATSAARVRDVARTADRPVGVLADLSGPKIRLGELEGGSLTLEPGGPFALIQGWSFCRRHQRRSRDVCRAGSGPAGRGSGAAGRRAVELRVVATGDDVVTEVVRRNDPFAGGVSVPSGRLTTPALTEKDRADVPIALELGVDYVAQSFVRRAEDIETSRSARRAVAADRGQDRDAAGDRRLRPILEVVDAVMIARGDLGVEPLRGGPDHPSSWSGAPWTAASRRSWRRRCWNR